MPNCIPFDLATIAGTLLTAGYEVEVYDVNAFRQTEETIDFNQELGIECGSFFTTPYPETPPYKNEESFLQSLENAMKFTINLTDFDDNTLFALRDAMDINQNIFSLKTPIFAMH